MYTPKICKLENLINLYQTDAKKLIENSEKDYQNQIKDIASELNKDNNVKVVLVAGPSSAGKTTTSKLITKYLNTYGKKAIVVSLDDFFIDRYKTPILPDGNYDYENITSLDIPYFNSFLKDLIEKNSALMPTYDFISGKRNKDYTPVNIYDNTIVIFEGIHALNPSLITFDSDNIKKIYISTNTTYICKNGMEISPIEIRFMRRMYRDFYNRGHSISATMSMWQNVLNGEIKYIDPYKNLADYSINSSHLYEPLILAKYLPPLICNNKNIELQKLLNFLNECPKMDKDNIPNNSLLQEFFVVNK